MIFFKKNYIFYLEIIKGYFLNVDLKCFIYFFIFFCEIKMYFYYNIGKFVYFRDLFKEFKYDVVFIIV